MRKINNWQPLFESNIEKYWYKETKDDKKFIVIKLINNDSNKNTYTYKLIVHEIELGYTEIPYLESICKINNIDWEDIENVNKLFFICNHNVGRIKSYYGNNYRKLINKVVV